MMVFPGALFVLLLPLGIHYYRRARVARARIERYPQEPWKWRADWAQGRLQCSGFAHDLGLGLAGVGVSVLYAPMLQFWNCAVDDEYFVWMSLVIAVCGIALAVVGGLGCRRRWRSGPSSLELTSGPFVIGERLSGRFERRENRFSSGRCIVRLACEVCGMPDVTVPGAPQNQRLDVKQSFLFGPGVPVVEETVPLEMANGRTTVPFSLAVPATAPATVLSFDDKHHVTWRLVFGFGSGLSFETVDFEVPVFARPKSAAA